MICFQIHLGVKRVLSDVPGNASTVSVQDDGSGEAVVDPIQEGEGVDDIAAELAAFFDAAAIEDSNVTCMRCRLRKPVLSEAGLLLTREASASRYGKPVHQKGQVRP